MSKTIEEQMACKCIHFNGIGSKVCKAGVSYESVKIQGVPFQFPCIQTGGFCDKASFRTPEQVEQELKDILEWSDKALQALFDVKAHINRTKQTAGQIPCACGGVVNYVRAESNGHIWGKCKSCGISFNE